MELSAIVCVLFLAQFQRSAATALEVSLERNGGEDPDGLPPCYFCTDKNSVFSCRTPDALKCKDGRNCEELRGLHCRKRLDLAKTCFALEAMTCDDSCVARPVDVELQADGGDSPDDDDSPDDEYDAKPQALLGTLAKSKLGIGGYSLTDFPSVREYKRNVSWKQHLEKTKTGDICMFHSEVEPTYQGIQAHTNGLWGHIGMFVWVSLREMELKDPGGARRQVKVKDEHWNQFSNRRDDIHIWPSLDQAKKTLGLMDLTEGSDDLRVLEPILALSDATTHPMHDLVIRYKKPPPGGFELIPAIEKMAFPFYSAIGVRRLKKELTPSEIDTLRAIFACQYARNTYYSDVNKVARAGKVENWLVQMFLGSSTPSEMDLVDGFCSSNQAFALMIMGKKTREEIDPKLKLNPLNWAPRDLQSNFKETYQQKMDLVHLYDLQMAKCHLDNSPTRQVQYNGIREDGIARLQKEYNICLEAVLCPDSPQDGHGMTDMEDELPMGDGKNKKESCKFDKFHKQFPEGFQKLRGYVMGFSSETSIEIIQGYESPEGQRAEAQYPPLAQPTPLELERSKKFLAALQEAADLEAEH